MTSINSFTTILCNFLSDRKAGVSVITAASILTLTGVMAFSLDMGRLYFEKRKQQTANDLASIAAAANPHQAMTSARKSLRRNGIDPNSIISLRMGAYIANPDIPVGERFTTNTFGKLPAVELTLARKIPLIFAGLIGGAEGRNGVVVNSRAISASNAEAAFSVGSRLLSLDGGLANTILGAMLGTSVNLSVMDYEALAKANVEVFSFFDALATRGSLKAVTYNEILNSSFSLPTVYNAMIDAGKFSAPVRYALSHLAAETSGTPDKISFKHWVSLGQSGSRESGTGALQDIKINALDFVSTTAKIASSGRLVEFDLAGNLPTGTTLKISLAIGEPKQHSGFVSVGTPDSVVHTAQMRLLINIKQSLAGLSELINIPLYVEAASAVAKLQSVSCAGRKAASVSVRPSLIAAKIANISASDLLHPITTQANEPARLVNLPLLKIFALGHIRMSNMKDQVLTFTDSEIRSRAVKTVSTQQPLTTLISSLLNETKVTVSGVAITGRVLGTAVNKALVAIAPVLDSTIGTTLALLGIKIGSADVQVGGVHCNSAALVR